MVNIPTQCHYYFTQTSDSPKHHLLLSQRDNNIQFFLRRTDSCRCMCSTEEKTKNCLKVTSELGKFSKHLLFFFPKGYINYENRDFCDSFQFYCEILSVTLLQSGLIEKVLSHCCFKANRNTFEFWYDYQSASSFTCFILWLLEEKIHLFKQN